MEGREWIISTSRCGKHANCKADRVSIIIIDEYQGVTCMLTKYETPFIPGVDTVEQYSSVVLVTYDRA